MPLLDHFHSPLSIERPWEGIHSTWASMIATQLNQDQLPAEYFAMPLVTLGGGVQVDVGTFQSDEQQESAPGGVATQLWAPPQPPLSARGSPSSAWLWPHLVRSSSSASRTR